MYATKVLALFGLLILLDNISVTEVEGLQVRIVDGPSTTSGRLEVSLDGINWGTVCDDYFGRDDARVACRMLGYSGDGMIMSDEIPDGTGLIFLDNLECLGNETSLLDCDNPGWNVENCSHDEDVGVSCCDC